MVTNKTTKRKTANRTRASYAKPRVAGSLADQINNMAVGDCLAVAAKRYPLIHGIGPVELVEDLKAMRNTLGVTVVRITDELDAREFKTESGSYLTDDKTALIASVVVTRMA